MRAISTIIDLYTPEEAWEELRRRRSAYYDECAALFCGSHDRLKATGECGSFWRRNGKGKMHVPVAADIASVGASMLFGEPPRFTIFDQSLGDTETGSQSRLEEIISENDLISKLHEAAEKNAAYGDVYLKCRYDQKAMTAPCVHVISGYDALPEYRVNALACVHFFTVIKVESKTGKLWRLYERYEPGRILSAVFFGDSASIGKLTNEVLGELDIVPEVVTPVSDMLAAHIPNMKPSRVWETGDKGRSDFEGIRDMMDGLDETYSSWVRDIRLAKSRLIVPAEFLRRKPDNMFTGENYGQYEFDQDIETLTALDIGGDGVDMKITPSQFAIRSGEHKETYESILRGIISMAGYAPQTFGLDINGNAESGKARQIMEKKSIQTTLKKQGYWRNPLGAFMTAVMRLDKALYGNDKFHDDDFVRVEFAPPIRTDAADMAQAVNLLLSAQSASTETRVKMLHPDWNENHVKEEVEKIRAEFGVDTGEAVPELGDLE